MKHRHPVLSCGLAMLMAWLLFQLAVSARSKPVLPPEPPPPPPGQYTIGLHDAYERLAKADFHDFKLERHCGILIRITRQGEPDRAVTWEVTSSGRRMLSFTATLTPVDDDTTKVDVRISREANGREAYDGNQDYVRPAVNQPVRPAIEEKIASLLTGRPYDAKRMSEKYSRDASCRIQRDGLLIGICFTVDDKPGTSGKC
jgi:hypothetical protein